MAWLNYSKRVVTVKSRGKRLLWGLYVGDRGQKIDGKNILEKNIGG